MTIRYLLLQKPAYSPAGKSHKSFVSLGKQNNKKLFKKTNECNKGPTVLLPLAR